MQDEIDHRDRRFAILFVSDSAPQSTLLAIPLYNGNLKCEKTICLSSRTK
jgi:hypothetical protein